MRCYFTQREFLLQKQTTQNQNGKCAQRCGIRVQCWWECKTVQLWWKNSKEVPPKKVQQFPEDPGIPLLGIHTEELRAGSQGCTGIPMFTPALFTAAKSGRKQVSRDRRTDQQSVVQTHNGIFQP